LSGSPASAHTNSKHAAQPASVAANKKVILAFLKDVLVEHHGDHAASYFTPNAQFHAGTVGTVTGNTNIGGLLTAVVTAIPNLHPALQDVVAQGNEVMVRLVVSGTMSGNLLGFRGTAVQCSGTRSTSTACRAERSARSGPPKISRRSSTTPVRTQPLGSTERTPLLEEGQAASAGFAAR
jgi:predicted ester cyclase